MSEDDLLARARAGDSTALEAFWELFSPPAYRLALLLSGSAETARDALQETWIALSSGLAGFDPAKGSARGWSFGILRHKVQKLQAKGRRRGLSLDLPVEGSDGVELGDLLPSGAGPPSEDLERREEIERMLRVLETLDPRMREAVACRWMLGMDDRALSEALGVSPEAARQRAHRGLVALREAMSKSEGPRSPAGPGREGGR